MHQSIFANVLKFKIFGHSPLDDFLRLNEKLWHSLPARITNLRAVHAYGRSLNSLAGLQRGQSLNFYTSFLRNRPQLELVRRLIDRKDKGAHLSVAVLACSMGPEVYSILWAIRSHRPDLKVSLTAMDLSSEAVEFARRGVYVPGSAAFTDAAIFAPVTRPEMREIFDDNGHGMTIRPWLREGITWRTADATDPQLPALLGQQDFVFVNNMLCHLPPEAAERCLRDIVKLVHPRGFLFVSGVDLNIRTKVVRQLGLEPVIDLIEEVHNGDRTLIGDWPFRYWGLEPLQKRRHDWRTRYATAFRVIGVSSGADAPPPKAPVEREEQVSARIPARSDT
jgi:chemotaxis methyl-accepting protein methylase